MRWQACHALPMENGEDNTDGGEDNGKETGPKRADRKRKNPRKITMSHLENVALWYLERFQATAKSLERVLIRRVYRSANFHEADPDIGIEMVKELIARYREAGLLDDRTYAIARTETLYRRGSSLRLISGRLREKGVDPEDIDHALNALRERLIADGMDENPDIAAAIRYAKRRRLGPWRSPERHRALAERDKIKDQETRDMGAMARAGFSRDVAMRALAKNSEDTE